MAQIAVIPFTAPNANGTVDITDGTQLGGLTPKFCMIFGGASGAGETVDARIIVGMYDGTRTRGIGTSSQDNSGSTEDFRENFNANIIDQPGAAAGFIRATATFITNGVRLNFAATVTGNRRYVAVLFAGTDVQAYVGDQDMGTGTSAIDITAPGFTPKLVIGMTTVLAGFTNGDNYVFCMGMATPSVQRSIEHSETDNVVTGSRPVQLVSTAALIDVVSSADGSAVFRWTVSDFDANGFSITPNATSPNLKFIYAALTFDGDCTLIDYDTPTATGIDSISVGSPAFVPVMGLAVMGSVTTRNSVAFDNAAAAGIQISAFSTAEAQAHSVRINHAADPTDAAELSTPDRAIQIPNTTNTAAVTAVFDSVASDGVNLNYTLADGLAHVGFMFLMFGSNDVPGAPSRVTQSIAYVGMLAEPPARVTQSIAYIGVKAEKPACLTTEADLWKITRADGTAYRFTSHNRALTVNGEVYTPCGGITSSALQLSAALGETDNIDLQGLVTTGAISAIDLWSGLFNGATVEISRVDWTDTATGYQEIILTGRTGALEIKDTSYRFEVVSAGQRLSQNAILQTVTPSCRYTLGDSRCGVNLASFTTTGSVTAVALPNLRTSATRRSFTDSSKVEAAEHWQFAKLTWTSGANTGITSDVRSFAGGVFVLDVAMPYDIALSDDYSIVRGCDKLPGTCHTVFSNKINFGGFEWVRGSDDLNKTPRDGL